MGSSKKATFTVPDGIKFISNTDRTACACVILRLSDDLKTLVRTNLSRICHGISRAEKDKKDLYGYRATLTEFLKRFEKKKRDTQLGMIGELLSHVLLLHLRNDLTSASPYFNLEERNIKKGFDIVLTQKRGKAYWIAEVKSGELNGKDCRSKMFGLIDLAKRDLHSRIKEKDAHLWHNAINHATVAFENRVKEKDQLQEYLEEFLQKAQSKKGGIKKLPNAILIPVIFESTDNPIAHNDVLAKHKKVVEENIFPECCVFAIQKSTIEAVIKFLKRDKD